MDIKIIETGNGGDVVYTEKDVLTIDGLENMVYLGIFGGNTRQSTPRVRLETQQAFDFWGNDFYLDNPALQINSETERVLNTTVLNSGGRELIIQAMKRDLAFMRPFAEVGVTVAIVGIDRVLLGVALRQPENQEQREFIFIWDRTRAELLQPYKPNLNPGIVPVIEGFNYDLNFDFEP